MTLSKSLIESVIATLKESVSVTVLAADGKTSSFTVPDDVVKVARSLKEDPFKYFTKPSGTKLVPVDKLVLSNVRPNGVVGAAKFMKLSYEGEHEKRIPIAVKPIENGQYLVLDGNSTTTVAKAAKWKTIPAIVHNKDTKQKDFH